ncbi:MAG: uroporphyrinogen-III synthase, partial [Candidatus Velthaea sp.]
MRVRFALPDGVRYLTGSARIDDQPLEEVRGETPVLAAAGADIGEVPPGVERRISIGYLVNPTIDNGATIALQAALASHETGVIGSNVVTLTAKSTPILQNPATIVALEAVRNAEPGEELHVTARVHNSGQSAARDVVVVLPVPDRTRFVAGSARVDGREVAGLDDRDDPFGFGRAPVTSASLAAGATLVLEYRALIDSPLENDSRIFAIGAVASAEVAEFELARAEITVRSASRFEGPATALVVDAPTEVEPGRRVRVSVDATNIGTCAANDVRIRIVLPDGLQYAPGSRAVDGRAVGENGEAGVFAFERIEAGVRIEAAVDAYVVSPAVDGTVLPVAASLQWSTGSRTFDRTLTVRSKPRFLEARNTFTLDGSTIVMPGAEVRAVARVVNDGTASATNVRLTLEADDVLQSLRYIDREVEARVQGGVISLGTLDANEEREIVIVGTVASPIGDRTEIRLGAALIANETATLSLGTLALVARSRARFAPATSTLHYASDGPMRPSGPGLVSVVLVNEGTDVAHDVRLALALSPEARLEGVDGATRDGAAIIFGDIAPGSRVEATARLRLARFVGRGATVMVHARLSGASLLPVALEPITIATLAEPNFADGPSVRTQPQDSVDAGEALYLHIVARNTGDGSAAKLVVRAALPEHTAYLPGSTSVNDVPLVDADGGSVLWSKAGLVLEDVDPGVEISVRYCVIVNTPLAAGTLIDPTAELHWDGGRSQTLVASAVRVRSTPAIVVIGNVVREREHIRWFDTGPLFGKKVLVTRAVGQADDLATKLWERGAEPILAPTIAIGPPDDLERAEGAVRNVRSYQWIVFTSTNGVAAFFDRLSASGGDARALGDVKVAAIGPKTAGALVAHGIRPDFTPAKFISEDVAEGLLERTASGDRILLYRAAEARDVLPQTLRAKDRIVEVVAAYKTALVLDAALAEAARRADVWTFTSASTVHGFNKNV